MKAKHRRLLENLPQSTLAAPRVANDVRDISRALKVHPDQVAESNEVSQGMGCGAPFRKDGMYVDTRTNKKRYMQEINRRAADAGDDKLVNFDGGYGDLT